MSARVSIRCTAILSSPMSYKPRRLLAPVAMRISPFAGQHKPATGRKWAARVGPRPPLTGDGARCCNQPDLEQIDERDQGGKMQPTLWRGALGAFLLAALAVPPMVSPAAAATELLIGTSHQTADAELPATVGIELGIFEKHGLDVKITDFGGGSRMIQAMTAGSIGIGVGAGSEMALIAKGAPVLAVCEDASSLPYFSVGLPYDSPIHSLDQLKGKKIGVTTEGSLTAWLARELARHQGWGPDALNIVAIGGKPEAVAAALRAHLIDAN